MAADLKLKTDAAKIARSQFSTMQSTITHLKDQEYVKFRDQLERSAYQFDWHPSFLDKDSPEPATRNQDHKYKEDKMNAYMILLSKTDGHEVDSLLADLGKG